MFWLSNNLESINQMFNLVHNDENPKGCSHDICLVSWSIADNPWSVSLFQSVLKLCYANMLNSDQTINQMYWYRTAAWAHSVFTLVLNLRTIWWFLSINVFDDWLLFDINKSYLKCNEKTTLTMINRINENRWRFQSGTECFSMICCLPLPALWCHRSVSWSHNKQLLLPLVHQVSFVTKTPEGIG